MAASTLDRPNELQSPEAATRGGRLLASAFLASLGSFLFGFDTAVISGTTASLRAVFELNDNTLGLTVSSALFGTMAGALVAGRPADWWGRRRVLALLAGLFLVSSVGCAGAWDWYALLFFRWLGRGRWGRVGGLPCLYHRDSTRASARSARCGQPIEYRPRRSALLFLQLPRGPAVGADNPAIWRWMFGVMVLPSVVFVLASALIPESPRWLVKKGRSAEAEGRAGSVGPSPAGSRVG